MNVRDLIPWDRRSSRAPMFYRDERESPFLRLHREMNRLFDEAFRSFDSPWRFERLSGWPSLEVSETDKELRVSAELPGLDEKDIEVLLADGALTIRGEKKSDMHDEERQFSERFYGRFERRISLDSEVEADKVGASFKNGVLTVTLPKTANAQPKAKHIPINGRK